jgi:DNA modification methylase
VDSDPAEIETGDAVTRTGDVWQLGSHRILCGNATVPSNYRSLMDGDVAQVVFTDPPYNVPVEGHVCGTGSIHHREFDMAAGEMTQDQFTKFLTKVFRLLNHHSMDGSIHFICMDWRHLLEMTHAGRESYTELKNLCVWNKTNGGLGSLYRSKHELVFVFKKGTEAHVNNVQLGRFGRNRTNVWNYPGISSIHPGRQESLSLHPTVKPIPMVADAILDCSTRGGIVLDAFGGSGTTLLAAEQVGRQARLIELDPLYVDVTIRRFQQLTGDAGTLVETGETFEEISARRLPTDETNANKEA